MRRGKQAKSASFERLAEDQQRIRNGHASAEGARSRAEPVVRPSLRLARGPTQAPAGARSEAKPSEAVVPAGSARRRTHN
jgi:hypothetical protein